VVGMCQQENEELQIARVHADLVFLSDKMFILGKPRWLINLSKNTHAT